MLLIFIFYSTSTPYHVHIIIYIYLYIYIYIISGTYLINIMIVKSIVWHALVVVVSLLLLHTCEGRETTGTTEEPPSSIKVIVSDTSGLRLQEVESVPWKVSSSSSSSSTKKNLNVNDGDEITIDLDTNQKYQTFDGIGGSFMRAGATLLNQMPDDVQEDILRDLFDKDDGMGIRLGKVPIGATDFGVPEWYTYADEPQSFDLPKFDMSHDLDEKQGFIPFLQRAVEVTTYICSYTHILIHITYIYSCMHMLIYIYVLKHAYIHIYICSYVHLFMGT